MRPQHFAVLAAVLLVMALVLLFAGRPAPETGRVAEPARRTITVMGEGEMRARPDRVTLSFGVTTWTQGASAAEAEALNLASRDRLAEAIRRLGIEADRIDPSPPRISPLTRQDYAGKTYLTGYQAESFLTVTLSSIQKADAVMAAGLGNGATSLESVVYGLEEAEAVRQKVVQAAIDNARERAAAIAKAQDRVLGDLLSVEILEEESPTDRSASSPQELLFRAKVRVTYTF